MTKRLIFGAAAMLCALAFCAGCARETQSVPSAVPAVSARPSPAPAETPRPSVAPEPASSPPPTPPPTPSPTAEPVPEGPGTLPGGIYTRRRAAYTDALIPADDYGPLVPYLGNKKGPYLNSGRWGLATLNGELVTDPVFSQIWRGVDGGNGGEHLPYLLLGKPDPVYEPPGWVNGEYDFGVNYDSIWAMAAPDGSWCTGFRYRVYRELTNWGLRGVGGACQCDGRGLFVRDAFDGSLVYLDGATGAELLRISDIPIDDVSAVWENGRLTGYYYDAENQFIGVTIDTVTGERLVAPDILFKGWGDGLLTAYDRSVWRTGYMDTEGNWVLPAVFSGADAFRDGKALVTLPDQAGDAFIDAQGTILLQASGLVRRGGQIWAVAELEWDEDVLSPRERIDAVYSADTLQPLESALTGRDFYRDYLFDDWYRYWNDEMEFYVSDGEIRGTRPDFNRYFHDYVTGAPYTAEYGEGSVRFYRLDGTLILAAPLPDPEDYVTLADGLLLVNGEESGSRSYFSDNAEDPYYPPLTASRFSGVMTPEGEWIFRYPLPPTPEGSE